MTRFVVVLLDIMGLASTRWKTKAKAVGRERSALSRKLATRPDVVIFENLTLAEFFGIVNMYYEKKPDGKRKHGPAKIADMYDLPRSTVLEILKAADGKLSNRVEYNADARRRRTEKLGNPIVGVHGASTIAHGADRELDVDEAPLRVVSLNILSNK